MNSADATTGVARLRSLSNFMFLSRWLQLPLYLGLIVAQGVYVFHFCVELVHLVEAAFGNRDALAFLVKSLDYKANPIVLADGATAYEQIKGLNEAIIMLMLLGFIDVVMISNLLIMVIVGGYDTFVSRVNLEGHPDEPEWLSHVNASVLKVKLAMALIGISSIHLLKTFISVNFVADRVVISQLAIHMGFLLSAMALAFTDRLLGQATRAHAH